ncbi:MAG: MBL fold metallo-hydrolase [Gammaproteobacteria bacterium]|nr:MBL fold metallo-hydrolase [Gammaproteobacteria bacterium]
MWLRRAKRVAWTAASLLLVTAIVLVLLWRNRVELDNIDWPAPPAATTGALAVTWLGVATVLFDDGETQILIDGFFSRPSLVDSLSRRPVSSDAATINFAMHEFGMRRLAAIIPLHSHFDHAMDVGAIALRSSASVLGSESTANIARGAGVSEDQIVVVEDGAEYSFGAFRVRLIESRHGPIGWRGSVPLDGAIDAPLQTPAPVQAMRVGKVWSVVVEHPQGTTLVQGSSGFIEGALEGVSADLAMLCTYGLSSLGRNYAEQYWREMVTTTGARAVTPIHFDDFSHAFGEVVPFPKVLDNFGTTVEWFEDFRDTWDVDTELYLPGFGAPIAVYSEPSSST